MDFDTLTKEEIEALGNSIPYTITISPHIYGRLEKHITILKKLIDRSATKQRWTSDAIKEKLLNDSKCEQPPKASTLNVKIEKNLCKELVDRVEYIKQFRVSYSKKQWIVDAVLEKLDRDEKEVEKKLQQLKKTGSPAEIDFKTRFEQLQTELNALKSEFENAF